MATAIRQAYQTNDVMTATPQKLQLMLIEAALREVMRARDHWREQREAPGIDSVMLAQKIMAELLGGLRPDQAPELVSQVAGVYLFVHRALVAAQADRQDKHLADAQRVLEVERETWQQVCASLVNQESVPAPHVRFTLEA